ncbi:transcriptional regulator, partial [Salmonella enterica subsp. enterica serovar Typhimurium]|nr:transcriptional regulator [Salmonella enterica subsp. enterica serovar 4,12:i:-]EDG1310885.1 transcriptional regulator [Salmonella enterica subsp. enterica serovar Typhimurium]EET8033291.1 transcriptional regulator [Escherichia coli]EDG9490252.1 transcriptional regulator [Salmonella enterica subsp. enterica serovar Typhimurium]EFH9164357.1 transcriptional regulator [Escherichia coli]
SMSLIRMLGSKGNPQASNLFAVIH